MVSTGSLHLMQYSLPPLPLAKNKSNHTIIPLWKKEMKTFNPILTHHYNDRHGPNNWNYGKENVIITTTTITRIDRTMEKVQVVAIRRIKTTTTRVGMVLPVIVVVVTSVLSPISVRLPKFDHRRVPVATVAAVTTTLIVAVVMVMYRNHPSHYDILQPHHYQQ